MNHIITEGANQTNCGKSRNDLAKTGDCYTAKQVNLVDCPECIRHPSEWCKIPSTWQAIMQPSRDGSRSYVRALKIVEKESGWNIQVKNDFLEEFLLDSEEFRKNYRLLTN